jgi:hypothetical protein
LEVAKKKGEILSELQGLAVQSPSLMAKASKVKKKN